MAIYKRGKIYFVQFQFKGKTHVRSSHSTRKADAVELENRMRAQLLDEIAGRKESIKLHDAIDEWMASRANLSNASAGPARNRWKAHFPNILVEDLSAQMYQRFLHNERKRGIQDSTLKIWTTHMKTFLGYLRRMNYRVPDITFPKIKPPKKKIEYFTTEQEARVLEELRRDTNSGYANYYRQEAEDYFILLLDTGMRPGEGDRLKWENIDLDRRVINLYRHKVGNEGVIPMSSRVYEILARRNEKRTTEWVFPDKDKKTHKKSSNVGLYNAFRNAGCEHLTVHACRRTFATRLVSAGVPIYTVSKLLGHASVKTTQEAYGHLVPDQQFENAINTINSINSKKPDLRLVVSDGRN